ncbi:MAG: glycerophosphodiester phosphodiesterase [Rubrivivax sp.]|nr:glycerophosphodiester phosphodiesterase [Rubrivivax sp.]
MTPTLRRLGRIFVATLLCAAAGAHGFDLQGHRGARGLAPENTLAAFDRALAVGVHTLELDVFLSADGVLMVTHDPALNPDQTRDADGRWLSATGPLVRTLTVAQLQAYDVGRLRPGSVGERNFPQQEARDGERMPTLAALLERVRARAPAALRLNIEVKLNPHRPDNTPAHERIVDALLATLQAAGMTARTSIQGFDWRPLQRVQQLAPAIPTVYLSAQQPRFDTVADGAWTAGFRLADHGTLPKMVQAAGGRIWSPNFNDLTEALLHEARQLGLKVVPWTVNEAADMERLIGWGVDGLITDYPDRARPVMAARGIALPPALKH